MGQSFENVAAVTERTVVMKIVNGILQDVSIPGVTFKVDIIPKGRKRRPGIAMKPQYITIHNTGCDKVPADNVVELDEERKAAMVSNLLVVLCGNRDAQPIVNSGSLY